ncbi:hypothetical protein DPMN_172015 [Dreissena polymorpha]|uniref:Uncharacterized protein n=1 Tax=Dreissena polymorpha TaxID=45954 RepID=A0A9D4IFN7_DREPO|nr:hypothetical protein DPMN_172015 [Dreissena polymorpha]
MKRRLSAQISFCANHWSGKRSTVAMRTSAQCFRFQLIVRLFLIIGDLPENSSEHLGEMADIRMSSTIQNVQLWKPSQEFNFQLEELSGSKRHSNHHTRLRIRYVLDG